MEDSLTASSTTTKSLNLVKLTSLMEVTKGRAEIVVGLIDGPVAKDNPDLSGVKIRDVSAQSNNLCNRSNDAACKHGTFVAGILSARRDSVAPAICPDCTLLLRPIFTETADGKWQIPSAKPGELATAIVECIEAGARVLNLSVALTQSSVRGQQELELSLRTTKCSKSRI